MPWTNEKPPKVIANRSAGAISAGVSAANSCLERGLSDEECIFAAIAAANNYDKKHQVKKAVKPAMPAHLQAVINKRLVEDVPVAKSEDIYLSNDDTPKIKQIELAPSWSFVQSLNAGDYFELMYACDSTDILINAPASTSFCPSTPSAVIKVNQVNL